MFESVLIANRGEIACRVIRACRELGLETVAVYSDIDETALHVEMADRARRIGPAKAAASYLDAEAILAAATETGAEAIHPGYGFLAENPGFASAVEAAGLTWIGPRHQTIADMGDKERARLLAKGAGVPILPGSARFGPGDTAGIAGAGDAVGYPLLVKASAGGGGIGMRRIDTPDQLEPVVSATQQLAEKSFGDGTIYLEKLIEPARHVEIQIFGFGDGRAVHLFERECSIQRRYQKIVEESPAPELSEATRTRMADAAVALAKQERYRGAGTVEFVVGPDGGFHFLEMNTRIQVEHPVTEMRTGVDLVQSQIRLARGEEPGDVEQDQVKASGHAVECRVYAERPEKRFLPSPGPLSVYAPPEERDWLRIDEGVREGDEITIHYDPMIAKIVAFGGNRGQALDRMAWALSEFRIEGVATNIAFLARLIDHPHFRAGKGDTGFVDAHLASLTDNGAAADDRD